MVQEFKHLRPLKWWFQPPYMSQKVSMNSVPNGWQQSRSDFYLYFWTSILTLDFKIERAWNRNGVFFMG